MSLKQNWPVLLVALLCLTGCGGQGWEKRGSQWEYRSGPASAANQPSTRQLPAQAAQADSEAGRNRLQEELLKQSAQLSTTGSREYRVGAEDLLAIAFLDADKLNSEARVNGKGEIRLLLVGDVPVAGLTPDEVAAKLARLYLKGDYLRNPQITVAVKEYRHQKVAVTGAVKKPDSYALIGPRTLLDVLGMAGGLSEEASEVAHIIRSAANLPASRADVPQQPATPAREMIVVDMNRLLIEGVSELNLSVGNGDVVYIPFAQTAHVVGSVMKPGSVFLKDNMTVAKAVAMSGGLNPMFASSKATIVRMDKNGERLAIPINLGKIFKGQAEDVALQENDIVFVPESATRRFMYDFKSFLPGSLGMSVPFPLM